MFLDWAGHDVHMICTQFACSALGGSASIRLFVALHLTSILHLDCRAAHSLQRASNLTLVAPSKEEVARAAGHNCAFFQVLSA